MQAIFSRPSSSVIVLLSLDPQSIVKSLDEDLQDSTRYTSSSWGFLQNMVDLPLYLISQPRIQKDDMNVNGAHTIRDVTAGPNRYCKEQWFHIII